MADTQSSAWTTKIFNFFFKLVYQASDPNYTDGATATARSDKNGRLLVVDALNAPGRKWTTVTPDNDNDNVPTASRGLWVSAAGTVTAIGIDDSGSVALGTLPVGTRIPGQFKRVLATGTTATVLSYS